MIRGTEIGIYVM